MADLIRRFRGAGIAFVVLALSAGVVFAGAPRIALVADEETPIEQPASEQPSAETPSDETPATETPDADASDDASDDADGAEAGAAEADEDSGHGALVSSAAQASTPPGFRNHGAFVSCVARWHKNAEAPAITDPTLLTPQDCGLEPTAAPDADADTGVDADEDGDPEAATGKAKGAEKAKEGKARAEAAKSKGKGKGKSGR